MKISRRQFLGSTTIGMLGSSSVIGADAKNQSEHAESPLIVSTWDFGKQANDVGMKTLLQGGTILDAVEQGIKTIESSGNPSVGLSGGPNAAGVVQLDACIMFGPGHKAGSVAGIEGIKHPISAARRVMEKTRHVLLVGEGARMFALEQGLESVDLDNSPA